MAHLFVLLCVFMLLFIHSTQADLVAGAGSCAAILQAGVYNTYSTSSVNSNNYSFFLVQNAIISTTVLYPHPLQSTEQNKHVAYVCSATIIATLLIK